MSQDAHKKAVLTKTPDSVGSPEVHMDPKAFNDLISDKGYRCYIERALRCPCVQPTNGGALSDCLNCGGTGWFFIDKQESALWCGSMSNKNKYQEWTQQNAGTINISARPEDKLGFMDRITLIELERWHTQILRFTKNVANNKMFCFVRYAPIRVFQLFRFISSTQQLVRIPDTDITLVDNQIQLNFATYGSITDLVCTCRFTHNPSYLVLDINRDLIKQTVQAVPCNTGLPTKQNFPVNCIGRLSHYVFDEPNFNGLGLFDNTDYTKLTNYNV